jgi:hypothetical protein
MRPPHRTLLLALIALLLLAVPATASAAGSVKRFPTGARVGTVSASATRTSTRVTVRVRLAVKVPAGKWKAGVLVSLLCGDRSLSGQQKTVAFRGKAGTTRRLTATIRVAPGRCSVKRKVVASVLLARAPAGSPVWARGRTAIRVR